MSVNGLVVMTPTSIASTGTGNSSSIGANGKVTFSSCATLSLNGVFTSSYDNYMVVMRFVGNDNQQNLLARLRVGGVDASGTNYTRQVLYATGTTVAAARTSSVTYFYYSLLDSEQRSGVTGYIFGPYLSQPTALRTVAGAGDSGAYIWDEANTHSLSTAYDGISFLTDVSTKTLSGLVTVYGFNQ